MPCRNSGRVLFDSLHPVAPATPPSGSVTGWVLLAIVLAVIVAGGIVLNSRR
jgi:hypothetical protein